MSLSDYFYVKECLGKDRELIRIYKIRTMVPTADEELESILSREHDHIGKPKEDPRITKVGAFLRRYWIDEIPQLYNLVRGDITFTGVRPMREVDWQMYPEDVMEESLRYKPGLVGFQYAFREEGGFDAHVEHMRHYLAEKSRHSFSTDTRYFFRVAVNVIFKGVRSS